MYMSSCQIWSIPWERNKWSAIGLEGWSAHFPWEPGMSVWSEMGWEWKALSFIYSRLGYWHTEKGLVFLLPRTGPRIYKAQYKMKMWGPLLKMKNVKMVINWEGDLFSTSCAPMEWPSLGLWGLPLGGRESGLTSLAQGLWLRWISEWLETKMNWHNNTCWFLGWFSVLRCF